MTKADIVDRIANDNGISKSVADGALRCFFDCVKDALRNDDTVTLVGFGTFSVSNRKARSGINPQTGKEIQIPATKAPKFRAGKSLKEAATGN